jgi:hypothetical protein
MLCLLVSLSEGPGAAGEEREEGEEEQAERETQG